VRADGGRGETHFRVAITAAAFAGLGRVARHRLVNAALAEELNGPVHALALTLKAPGE
jgi:BolA protein